MDETPNSTNECFQSVIGEGAAGFVGQDSDKVHVPEGQNGNGAARKGDLGKKEPALSVEQIAFANVLGRILAQRWSEKSENRRRSDST